jgi:hypothetical protein
MKYKTLIISLLLFSIFLVGCGKQTPTETPEPTPKELSPVEEEQSGYPVPEEQVGYPIESGYPVEDYSNPSESGYPIEEVQTNYKQGPEFFIDEPVREGDTVVKGTGPAGVPIILVDISQIDVVLGETVIEDDGTFEFETSEPLNAGHSIGLQLGDIEGTDLNPSDFLYSPTYYERPLIGILFYIANVE